MVMRRRFSRRRRKPEEGQQEPIDARWLERAGQTPTLAEATVEAAQPEDVPTELALVGRTGTEPDSKIVSVSPDSGGNALIAGIVAAARVEGASPEVLAFATNWDAASRRRLGVLAGFQPAAQALIVPPESADPEVVAAEPAGLPLWTRPDAIGAQVSTSEGRALFVRALEAFRGLAAKHGGALRAVGGSIELVVMARAIANLRADGPRVLLEVLEPSRSLVPLTEDGVSDAMDRLEGSMRKRLNDRRTRDGEEGLRGRWLAPLESAAGLRFARRWPFGGEGSAIDLVGVTDDGLAVIGAIRERFTLQGLGQVLDAALVAEPWLATALADAGPPLRGDRPRLVLAASTFDGATQAVLAHLGLPVSCYEGASEGALKLMSELAATVVPVPESRPSRNRGDGNRGDGEGRNRNRGGEGRGRNQNRDEGDNRPAQADGGEEGGENAGEQGEGGARRRRSRGRRRRGGERSSEGNDNEGESTRSEPARVAANESNSEEDPESLIDEFSLFDLDEETDGDRGGSRRRGRGRRGRGSRGPKEETSSERSSDEPDSAPGAPSASDDDDLVDDEDLGLSPDAPDLDEGPEVAAYEDEEEEPLTELQRQRLERESRRKAQKAAMPVVMTSEEGTSDPEAAELPRGRAAILVHADRQSIAAAVLLARDLRQIEGIWVYPQEDLMTFFRGVATDLRDKTPIFVIGFAAKPARESIQAAALYRGRLVWFDHHNWPPEDLGALKEAIGPEYTRVEPGAGSTLPLVLPECSRRSRFSEKLVDLVTGRFTHHDFQRWGRTWWWRLGEIAKKTGERRSDLEMLLAGRPSDLAKEAAHADDAPPTSEFTYVSERDFRLVHFAGLGLVVATLPPTVDLSLAMRIARERYSAAISLASVEGEDMFVLGADDGSGKRSVDLTGMLEHLNEKFAWVLPGADADHVARFRIKNLAEQPERLDEVVAEIGMGRSVLEG